MRLHPFGSFARSVITGCLVIALAGVAHGATITIVNLDGPGEGFNDPTSAAPVGNNPGTTVGAQRLYVFNYAARIWGSLLQSPVEILVEANFDPLTCNGSSAVLGSAGPNSLHSDFQGAAHTLTWYHQALANKLSGEDQDVTTTDIGARFNSDLGKPGCFPVGWYYGVDGREGSNVELLPVVLHELGHGLGFSTSTIAGVQEVFPHIYDYFLYDNTQGMHWPDMTEPQRTASSTSCGSLVWDGGNVTLVSSTALGPKPLLRVNAPAATAGDYNVGLASFGAPLGSPGITADVVLGNDGVGVPTNGCETLLNAAAISGKIALLDRGGCPFVIKAKNAQNAGAVGLIVADSVPGCPALGMSGVDPTITIPVVRVTHDDGARLKAALLVGMLNVTLRVDPSQRAGSDAAGHIKVYTPTPYATGSSVSHWDISATPNLLMEPALNPDLSADPDLTINQLADIGWFQSLVSVEPSHRQRGLEPGFPNPTRGAATIAYSLSRAEAVTLTVHDLSGRLVARLVEGRIPEGRHAVKWDGTDRSGHPVPAGVYHYRLKTSSFEDRSHLVIVR